MSLITDMPEVEYHAHAGSLSQTGAKVLLDCPALFRWQADNPKPHRAAFDYGHAAHELVLGVGQGLAIIPPTSRSKADQVAHAEAKEAAYAEGKTPVTSEDYAKVQAMADRLSSHTLAMTLLSDGQPEVSAFATHEPTGVLRRSRFDWLAPTLIVDYKTTASANPRDLAGRYGSVQKWGYDFQAAWYLDIARDLGHPAQEFAFIFQMKEPPYLVTVAVLRDSDLADARERNRQALEMYRDCTESGYWPGYLADDEYAVLSLDSQHFDTERITAS